MSVPHPREMMRPASSLIIYTTINSCDENLLSAPLELLSPLITPIVKYLKARDVIVRVGAGSHNYPRDEDNPIVEPPSRGMCSPLCARILPPLSFTRTHTHALHGFQSKNTERYMGCGLCDG